MISRTSAPRYLLLLLLLIVIVGMMNNPKRNRYLIPEKFYGTVYVYYNVKDAPPLPMEDGFRLIVVPENGIVRTSSPPIGGEFYDEEWLYSGEKRVRMSPYKLGGGSTVQQKNSLGEQEVFHKFNVLKEERKH